MKTIQPVTVWYNGEERQATVLSAYASSDNLINIANFTYQIMIETGIPGGALASLIPVVTGQLVMTGEVYQNWETNDYAYDWIAQQLNLTITGPYVPPVPTTTSTTTEAPSTTSTTTTKKA